MSDDEEDLKELFGKSNPIYDMSNLKEEEMFRKALMTADSARRTGNQNPNLSRLATPKTAAMRLGTPSGFQHRLGSSRVSLSGYRPITGFRPPTGSDSINRPVTAVRGAGYSSHNRTFDPLNQGADAVTPPLELPKDESPEEKLRQQEAKVMRLIEESCRASCEGNLRAALEKAKEASNKERNLIRAQEQAGVQGDGHNLDLTFVVLFTLASQYAANELYVEALNTYQMITRNRMFSNGHRLKLNVGNIYEKLGQHPQAVKLYRMALDQVPSSQKNLRIKILHNIATVLVRMGQWEEAASNLEYIMTERAGHRTGLHLIICCIALEDRERIRKAFDLLLSVPLDLEDDEKYSHEQEESQDRIIASAIRNDELHTYEKRKQADTEYCIVTAAKLIAPLVEDDFGRGYDWCVSAVKSSEYARLAGDLEINKAVMFLKRRQINEAIDTLKAFGNESTIASSAAVNLSFIYFQQKDYENAERYALSAKNLDAYNASGFVNLGACCIVKNQLEDAKSYLLNALDLDPACFEALFNLGSVLKLQGNYEDALECFQKFSGSLALVPEVVYQIASSFEGLGDNEAAAEAYQQLLGLLPTDATVLQKLGELYDNEGDKQQAHHYHIESFRYNPSNLSVLDWLGSYYIEMQVIEKALVYFEKASLMQPDEPKWRMMMAGCHRRTGNLHKALTLYQEIRVKFPENVECLRFLIHLAGELGMREAHDYTLELKRLERSKEVRDRVGSSRPGSRMGAGRTGSGLSSRSGSGFGSALPPTLEYKSSNGSLRSTSIRSGGSGDSGFVPMQSVIDATYLDPLGPLPTRPRTGAGKPLDFEDFGDELLGDDLLPQ